MLSHLILTNVYYEGKGEVDYLREYYVPRDKHTSFQDVVFAKHPNT